MASLEGGGGLAAEAYAPRGAASAAWRLSGSPPAVPKRRGACVSPPSTSVRYRWLVMDRLLRSVSERTAEAALQKGDLAQSRSLLAQLATLSEMVDAPPPHPDRSMAATLT